MRALQITARLATPVQGVDPIHLDGLIEWAWYQEHPEQDHGVSRVAPPPPPAPLPLARGCHEGIALWLCSAWLPSPNDVQWFVKRRDDVDREAYAKPYTPGAGPGRNMMLRRPTTVASEAVWRAHGDPGEVASLLRAHVGYLGSRRRAGLGRILKWTVEVIEDVPPWWALLDDRGRAARNLPTAWCASWEGSVRHGAVEGPYWHPQRQQAIVPAGRGVQIAEGCPEQVV